MGPLKWMIWVVQYPYFRKSLYPPTPAECWGSARRAGDSFQRETERDIDRDSDKACERQRQRQRESPPTTGFLTSSELGFALRLSGIPTDRDTDRDRDRHRNRQSETETETERKPETTETETDRDKDRDSDKACETETETETERESPPTTGKYRSSD